MTPQSSFMVVAPIAPAHEQRLRGLLASMNLAPGRVDAGNAVIPFGRFDTLHFARLLIIDDKSLDDGRVYGLARPNYPLYLAFIGDIDGPVEDFFTVAVARAGAGLRSLFSCCEGFPPDGDLRAWLIAHDVSPAAAYVNWRGRTVRQVHEDAALRDALERHAREHAAALEGMRPRDVHAMLKDLVARDVSEGRLTLTPDSPTTYAWWVNNVAHLVGVPLLVIATSPALVLFALIAVVRLRQLEKSDPELCPRADSAHTRALAAIEDHDVTNQFTAMGSLKPGAVRLAITMLVLTGIDYAARHLYTRGRLARVRSIHFARWVFLDNRRRVIFLSNYDGSLESYMDDFINKVGFGLNVVFSNGIGYPRTNWLLLDGCSDERKFKEFLRRHQLPTDVWYKAYPGLTAVDLERNARLRQGLTTPSMDDGAAREWLALL